MSRARQGRADAGLVLLGGVLVALTGLGLLLHRPGADSVGSVAQVNVFVAVLAGAGLAFLAAAALVLRHGGGRRTLAIVLGFAVLMRVGPLLAPPFLSSDLYRYVWDGRVQRAGINPYRFIPADPALRPLRDRLIYPRINRRDYAPTIYPPAAQLLFRLLASVSQTAFAVKLGAVLFEVLAIGCAISVLRRAGIPAARVALYAWNPLAVWCFAGNGHVDAAAIGLIGLAVLLRLRGRDGWCALALCAAVLVKFLPAAIVPAFWRGRWRFPAVLAVSLPLFYLPFLGVGWRHVLGFLGAYGGEEGIADGHGVWLLAGLSHLVPPDTAIVHGYLLLAGVCLGALAVSVGLARGAGDGADAVMTLGARCGFLAAASFLVLSPHYPWYFPWFGLFAVFSTARTMLWLSVAPLALYLDPFGEFFVWPSLVWVPALLLLPGDLRYGRLSAGPVPVPFPLRREQAPT